LTKREIVLIVDHLENIKLIVDKIYGLLAQIIKREDLVLDETFKEQKTQDLIDKETF